MELGDEEKEAKIRLKLLSISQDLMYVASGETKWGPKHVGLGSTLHQITRSKQLVELFHSAGHCLNYRSILQMDTSLAENTLKSMDPITGAVVPPNLVPGKFTHFTADNIDISDASLDGKNTFHATQFAAWQRGPSSDLLLDDLKPSKNSTLNIPDVMDTLIPVNVIEGKSEPIFTEDVQEEWFNQVTEVSQVAEEAAATDMAFIMKRAQENPKSSWSAFNQSVSEVNPEVTTVGYMPIIQAPAHELDTLNTVVRRCLHVSQALEQRYVVLTVDEALYCKLMELKWSIPEYKELLIPRLGGLHTAMNFLKAIGKHVQSSGLSEAWVESGILGPNSTDQAMAGKSYSRGMRAHKITFQAMWQILLPELLSSLEEHDRDLKADVLQTSAKDDCDELVSLLRTTRFQDQMTSFLTKRKENVNFSYWWQYMQMVSILLMFTRAQRDGLWDLHLHSFKCMLPFFMRYDHIKYARWGAIYIAEMQQLPAGVEAEFQLGNFVVKRSAQRFSQVDPDQSQEWLNGTGKKGGGIVGITKTPTALSRWALSYNLRAHIAASTREMFRVGLDDQLIHKESTKSRKLQDNKDEEAMLSTLQVFKVFSPDASSSVLQNIATESGY